MNGLLLVILAGVIAGVAVGTQSPLASIIGQRLGALESVFIIHLGGAFLSGTFLLLMGGGKLTSWRVVPWYALIGGFFGLVVVGAMTYTIPKIGATASSLLVVCGQIIIGLVIDQFGLLDTDVRPLELSRVLGIVVMFAGLWMVVR